MFEQKEILVWPDGTWICPEEESDLDWALVGKSDDYKAYYVNADYDYETIDLMVQDILTKF